MGKGETLGTNQQQHRHFTAEELHRRSRQSPALLMLTDPAVGPPLSPRTPLPAVCPRPGLPGAQGRSPRPPGSWTAAPAPPPAGALLALMINTAQPPTHSPAWLTLLNVSDPEFGWFWPVSLGNALLNLLQFCSMLFYYDLHKSLNPSSLQFHHLKLPLLHPSAKENDTLTLTSSSCTHNYTYLLMYTCTHNYRYLLEMYPACLQWHLSHNVSSIQSHSPFRDVSYVHSPLHFSLNVSYMHHTHIYLLEIYSTYRILWILEMYPTHTFLS